MPPSDLPGAVDTPATESPERIFPFVVKMCFWSAVVVVVGFFALFALLLALAVVFREDDMPYVARRTDEGAWSLGPAPTVAVDLPLASIRVLPSPDDRVAASLEVEVITDVPQAKADRTLAAVGSAYRVEGGGLIVATPRPFNLASGPRFALTLQVPVGASLDLRTANGPVEVGEPARPVVARSIRVRNDSSLRSHMNGGDVWDGDVRIECRAFAPPGQTPAPVALDVEAPGLIRVEADRATVRVVARHGLPPAYWGPAGIRSYEDGVEGSVAVRATLVGAANSIRAAHRIRLDLPPDASLRYDAEATGGAVAVDSFPTLVESGDGRIRRAGTLGAGPGRGASGLLRTDAGPIRIDPRP